MSWRFENCFQIAATDTTSITTDSMIVPDIEAAAAAAAIMTTETSGLMTKPTGKSSPELSSHSRADIATISPSDEREEYFPSQWAVSSLKMPVNYMCNRHCALRNPFIIAPSAESVSRRNQSKIDI